MSYLDAEYHSFHNNIIDFIITLLVSYVWKVCNETLLPSVDFIFYVVYSQDTSTVNTKNNRFIFFPQCSI